MRRLGLFFTFGVILSVLNTSGAYGDTTTNPNPAPTSLDQFNTICANYQNLSTNDVHAQYCASTQSDMDAANTSQILFKLYTAVAAECAVECAMSFLKGPSSLLSMGVGKYTSYCMIFSGAVAVTDGVMTSDLSSTFQNILGMAMGGGINMAASHVGKGEHETAAQKAEQGEQKAEQAAEQETKQGTKNDVGACVIAAMSGVMAYQQYAGAQSALSSAMTDLTSAMSTISSQAISGVSTSNLSSSGSTGSSTGSAGTTQISSPSGGSSGGGSSGGGSGSNPCGDSSSLNGISACAQAAAPGLVPATTPQYANQFQNTTGQGLGNFLQNTTSPAQGMAAAMAGSGMMNGSQAGQLESILENKLPEMAAKIAPAMADTPVSTAVYSNGGAGGGRSPGSEGDGDPDFAGMVGQMMEQMMPGKKDKGAAAALLHAAEIEFPQLKGKTAQQMVSDPSVNLFMRVSFRYFIRSPEFLR